MIKVIAGRVWTDLRKYYWGGILAALYYLFVQWFLPVSCPSVMMTGLPCSGCGMTRAITSVLTGQFARAFFMNPIAFLIVIFAGYCLVCRYVCGRPVKGFVQGIVILLILLFVLYLVRMYLYFPDRVPYVYTRNNMLEQRIPGYRDFIDRIWLSITG
ncbi:MAG: DUF2752 domain-containing protein [Lachnospiraceae bacterium]|nr:DUF2752 domain-containing protein [Lachnospiraceae bacterium]